MPDVNEFNTHKEWIIARQKSNLEYNEFRNMCFNLSEIVTKDGYKPEAILCIARGGLLVGGQLSYDMKVKAIGSINIEFYTDIGKTLDKPLVTFPEINLDQFKNKKLLIVDDVVDTGKTVELLTTICKYITNDIKVASLYKKTGTIFNPDYFVKEVSSNVWIEFPWNQSVKKEKLNLC